MKLWKRLGAIALTVALVAGFSISSASACTSIYVGSELTENGSTFVGRSEDIGKLYDKIFEVHEAADHADGEMYEDTYGFTMPFPAHTYRYTVVRDSVEAGETMEDENGNYIGEAYGEAGVNENGVAVSATVSTYYGDAIDEIDPLVDTGICEISLNSVILQSARTAREGVEILAAIIDEYGAGECNSLSISDANEVWFFEIVSGHQYVALRMPSDKVAINPNILMMNEVDVSDTENVVASKELISLPLEHNLLVTSQNRECADPADITVIDIARTYGVENAGAGQYTRYWQGVYYLNQAMAEDVPISFADTDEVPAFIFDADRELSTYEVLRFLATRGEGSEHASEVTGEYAVGNDRQAECHIFEIRDNMPDQLAIIQWQTMSRAEFSVFLPFYSALLTDTSDIYKDEYLPSAKNIEDVIDDEDFPAETSAYWVFAAINDLCDNDRERYGTNVKAFWEDYQKALIEQQAAVDKAMLNIYNASPESAEEAATVLGKAVAEEAFGYAKQILSELWDFIQADEAGELAEDAVFTPSVMGKLPTYGSSTIFVDVASGKWYEAAVEYAVENNLILGVSGSKFAPTTPATRGQFMTILARYAGVDTNGSSPWYKAGQEWAVQTGVSDGTSVDKNIKRQDLVTMLWRLEGRPEVDQDLSAFSDASEINDYALQAMQWAVQSGVLNGDGNGHLFPDASTNRCDLAQIMMNYIENIKG